MKEYKGLTASDGLVMGPLVHLRRGISGLSRIVQDPSRERALFEAATVLAKDELKRLEEKAQGDDKDIFLFQRVLLDDEALLNEVCDYIAAGAGSATAVERAAQVFATRIGNVDDDYIRQRSADVMDACQRVVDILDGRPTKKPTLTEPSVLISEAFYPSDVVGLDRGMVLGIVATAGSLQSHAAIIARTMNIPAIVQVGKDVLDEEDGTPVLLDSERSVLVVDPDAATVADAKKRQQAARRGLARKKNGPTPCVTRDGVTVTLLANASGPEDIEQSIGAGAQGIGLVRTEFFLMNGRLPNEEEQYYYYLSCAAAAGGQLIIFRTFDIGADKAVSGLSWHEDNPALGRRGIRATLARPTVMIDQLCALLRVAARADMRVMFPMVGNAAQWDACMQMVQQARDKLRRRGVKFNADLEFGCMIEVPSAALEAEELIAHGARFFSVGTNDLVQYTCAVDRMDERLAEYYRPDSPGVLRLIQMAADAAHAHNIPISVCGLSAADPDMAERFVRMGIHCLSMASQSLPRVSARLSQLTVDPNAPAPEKAEKPEKTEKKEKAAARAPKAEKPAHPAKAEKTAPEKPAAAAEAEKPAAEKPKKAQGGEKAGKQEALV